YRKLAIFLKSGLNLHDCIFHYFLLTLIRSPLGKKISTIIKNTNAIISLRLDENRAIPKFSKIPMISPPIAESGVSTNPPNTEALNAFIVAIPPIDADSDP